MRFHALVFIAALTATPAVAATIAPTDAASHVGQTVTVEGIVSNVYDSRGGTVFVDMGGNYPNSTFTGVIFSSDVGTFPAHDGWTGHTVDITGAIKLYKGKPEIILKSPNQVSVVR